MQTISFTTSLHQSLFLPPPFSGKLKRFGNGRERASTSILAMRSDGSRVVDENMVVLKMRIQEFMDREKVKEEEWEWFKNYDSDVYELVGLLQILMMNSRPSLVLGVFALLLFTSSTSLLLLFSYFLGILT